MPRKMLHLPWDNGTVNIILDQKVQMTPPSSKLMIFQASFASLLHDIKSIIFVKGIQRVYQVILTQFSSGHFGTHSFFYIFLLII